MFGMILLASAAGAPPAFVVDDKTVNPFVVVDKTRTRERFTDIHGVTYEKCDDGHFRAVPGPKPAPAKAAPPAYLPAFPGTPFGFAPRGQNCTPFG